MSIIKQKIKYNNSDMNIKLNLCSNNNLYGYQQEIDSFIKKETDKSINGVVDNEIRRFKPSISGSRISFYFYDDITDSYIFSYKNAGFTDSEILQKSINYLNSFFILEFYDSFDINSQNKIFTMYNMSLDEFSFFNLISTSEFYYLNVPIYYFQGKDTVTGYVKFSFYNAKKGKLQSFYNYENGGLTTPEKLFFKTILNVNERTWYFDTESFLNPEFNAVAAWELIDSDEYQNKLNNGINNYKSLEQTTPSGNVFDVNTGRYVNLD